jgi:DNA-binding Xre family transcriptional regulator
MSSLSRASNISFNTIKRLWTRPYEGAKIDTLLRIARVLDVQVTDLLEELED